MKEPMGKLTLLSIKKPDISIGYFDENGTGSH